MRILKVFRDSASNHLIPVFSAVREADHFTMFNKFREKEFKIEVTGKLPLFRLFYLYLILKMKTCY